MKDTTKKAGSKKNVAAPAMITIPKIEGLRAELWKGVADPKLRSALQLTVRILQPESLDDSAEALLELLHQIGFEGDKSQRETLTCFSNVQSMMLCSDWMETFKELRAMSERRRARREKGGA